MQNGETILQFTASGPNSTCTLKLGLENSTIGVSGFIVTTIEALHTIPTTPDNDGVSPYKGLSLNFNSASLDDFRSSISKIIQVWKAAKDTANFTTRSVKHYYRATKESVHGAFRQTIVAGRIGPDKKTPLALQFSDLKIFAEHATILPWGLGPLASTGKLTGIRGQKVVLAAVQKSSWKPPGPGFGAFFQRTCVMEGRRMIRASDNRLLGLVPQAAEVGDKIALLQEASLPIVLRERGSEWEVVGDAYVHGLIHRERWDESKAGDMWLA